MRTKGVLMKRPSVGVCLVGIAALAVVTIFLYSISMHVNQVDVNSLRGRQVTRIGPVTVWTWHEGDGLSKRIKSPQGLSPKWRTTSSASQSIRWHTRLSEVFYYLHELVIVGDMCPDAGYDDVIQHAAKMLRNDQIDECRDYLKPIMLSLEQKMKNCEPVGQ